MTDVVARDHALRAGLLFGERVLDVQHQLLHDHPEAAGADAAHERPVRDRLEGIVGEAERDVLVVEQPLVLPDQRVPRLGEDAHEGRPVELLEGGDDGQAPDELGNHAETHEVVRLDTPGRGL